MSQQSPEERPSKEQPIDEHLSETLLGSLYQAARGLGTLGSVLFGGGLFAIVAGGIVYLLIPDLRLYASIILAIGACLLLIGIVSSWPSVQATIGARRGRYGINTTVMIAAFLGIAAVATFLALEHTSRMDVTATNQFTLAQRTKKLLNNLTEPVVARAFFVQDDTRLTADAADLFESVEDLLREFDARSDKFSYKIVDPETNPGEARAYQVTQYGTIAFKAKNSEAQPHHVQPSFFREGGIRKTFLEQEFVTALLIVTGEKQKRISFITGHQERNIDDTTPGSDGFGYASLNGLRGENYDVAAINLLAEPEKLKEATVVVIAGPKRDPLESELEALDAYLEGGGLMLALVDPETPESFREFLRRWGVEVENGYIVEKGSHLGEDTLTPIAEPQAYVDQLIALDLSLLSDPSQFVSLLQLGYGYEAAAPFLSSLLGSIIEITAPLERTFYPNVTALSPAEGVAFYPPLQSLAEGEFAEPPALWGTALVSTSSNSWLVDDPLRSEPQEDDLRGPFFTALAIRALVAPLGGDSPDCNQRQIACIVVIGDSDFASNKNFYDTRFTNSDFFLNAVNWLAGDVSLSSARSRPLSPRRDLILDPNQRDFVKYTSWFLLPTAMALMAGVVWWRRR